MEVIRNVQERVVLKIVIDDDEDEVQALAGGDIRNLP
jgi:hypothetical protein